MTAGNGSYGGYNASTGKFFVQEFEFGKEGMAPMFGPVFLSQTNNSVTIMRTEPTAFNSVTFFTTLSANNLFPPTS